MRPLLIFLFLLNTVVAQSAFVINEFMAVNDASSSDGQGEFDDWVEIYNPEDAPWWSLLEQ